MSILGEILEIANNLLSSLKSLNEVSKPNQMPILRSILNVCRNSINYILVLMNFDFLF